VFWLGLLSVAFVLDLRDLLRHRRQQRLSVFTSGPFRKRK
jgi:hypothetical protein